MRRYPVLSLAWTVTFLSLSLGQLTAQEASSPQLEKIILNPGFKIDLYAGNVRNARSLVRSPEGVLFVGTRSAGFVWAVVDSNGDHQADRIVQIAEGLLMALSR